MDAIRYIVDTLLWLLTLAFVLRLLFQWVRADFRDPMADAIVRVTNWLIVPLRRLLPPIGRIDTATVLAVLATATRAHRCDAGDRRHGVGQSRACSLRITVVGLIDLILRIYLFALLLYWITSFVAPGGYAPGIAIARATVRTDLEAGAPDDSADRTNRFLGPVGVDRDRRAVDTSALNMHS